MRSDKGENDQKKKQTRLLFSFFGVYELDRDFDLRLGDCDCEAGNEHRNLQIVGALALTKCGYRVV
nr:hypothetical protein [Bacillaceae bacterium JMAK1]